MVSKLRGFRSVGVLLNSSVVIRISLAHRRPCLCTYSAGGDGRTYAHVCHSMAPSSRYCGGWVASRDTGHDYDLGSRHSAPTRGERARLGVRLPKSLTSINTPPLTRGKTMHVLAVKDGAHSIARTTHTRQTFTLSACGPGTNPLQSSRNIRTPPYRTMSTAFTASTAPFGY